MNRYDLHVHTDASPCSATAPERVARGAVAAGLDGIVVTDHDPMANVSAVRAAAPDSLTVVPGVEVTTTEGHLLAIDVTTVPDPGPPLAVVEQVHDQNGFAVLAHPFDTLRQQFSPDLDELAARVDAVEVINSRTVKPADNRRARAFASRHRVPATGGSDAHFPFELGRAFTRSEAPLRAALERGDVEPAGRGTYLSGHVRTKATLYRARLPF